jgi:hypothetical protein
VERRNVASARRNQESESHAAAAAASVAVVGRRRGRLGTRKRNCALSFRKLRGRKMSIARARETERWRGAVNAMVEGLSVAKAAQLSGVCASTAFPLRPRLQAQPPRGKRGTLARIVGPATSKPNPNCAIQINSLNAYQGRLNQWMRHGGGAEHPRNPPGFCRAVAACSDQVTPDRILAALHRFRFIPAILLTLNGSLALAVPPSHSTPSSHSTSPTPSPSPSPAPAPAPSPAPAPAAAPAPGHASAPAPASAAAAGSVSTPGHVFYLSSCGLIRPCVVGQSANAPLVAVPY